MEAERIFGKSVSEYRRQIASQPACRFVDRDEYYDLIMSRRKLDRADDYSARLRGLLDRISGERYLIEDEKLFAADAVA